MEVRDLTPAQCVLLAVHLASEANMNALWSFTPARLDALQPELVLRILLTYLPEAVDPSEYITYVGEVASRLYLDIDRQDVEVNLSAVSDVTDEQAQKRVKKLHLRQLKSPSVPPDAPQDILVEFICHRAGRIDQETGMLELIPKLVEPFLERNDYIRTWYISTVLPIIRIGTEYYPGEETLIMSLDDFSDLSGSQGVEFLLRKASDSSSTPTEGELTRYDSKIGRDVKGLVGPWMYGHTEKKRRKLKHDHKAANSSSDDDGVDGLVRRTGKIGLSGVTKDDMTGHAWEYMFQWMVRHAMNQFYLVSSAIEDWDGPADIDTGGFDRAVIRYLDQDLQSKLQLQYAQASFASCYAAQGNTPQTVRLAHGVLARLAELLDFVPPPDLATSVDSLPRIERHAAKLSESQTVADLAPDALLRPEHPLTTPRMETYMLLQMMVYSAYQYSGLAHPLSLANVAKLHFYSSADEQLDVLRKILRGLAKSGAHSYDTQWVADRAKLIWLWNWGLEPDEDDPNHGAGTLGKISKEDFEKEMLRTFTETSLEHVDPVKNTDSLGGIASEDLGFPFVVTDEDEEALNMQKALTEDGPQAIT